MTTLASSNQSCIGANRERARCSDALLKVFFRENARCFWYTHYRHFCWRRCVLINKYRKRTNHRLFLPTHNWNGVCGRYFTFGRCFVISLFFSSFFCIDFMCKRCSCCILITYCHQLWSKGAHVYKDLSGLLML